MRIDELFWNDENVTHLWAAHQVTSDEIEEIIFGVEAARNLKSMAVSSTVTACGAGSSGARRKTRVKLPAMKQELGVNPAAA